MAATTYYVVNSSSCISNDDVQVMVQACNTFLPIVARAWSVLAPAVVFTSGQAQIATSDALFNIIDRDPSQPDALAYHTENASQVIGNILAQTILDNGGVALFQDRATPTIASALFHELAEALMDPTVNNWYLAPDGTMYAAEVCDPVQDNIVPIKVGGQTVGLSDFIYPAWRDSQSSGPYNYLKTLTSPFQIAKGGYAVVFQDGQINQVFGELMPQWLKAAKQNSGRLASRKTQTPPTVRSPVPVTTLKKVEHTCYKCGKVRKVSSEEKRDKRKTQKHHKKRSMWEI